MGGGMKAMLYIMPLFSLWIGFSYPMGLGLYWCYSSLFALGQTIVLNKVYTPSHVAELVERDIAKQKKSVDFLSKGKIFVIISALVIVGGIAVMIGYKVKTGNALAYSLEFLGGTSTTATLNEDLSLEQIDEKITPNIEKITGDGNVQVTKVEGSNEIIVKTRTLPENTMLTKERSHRRPSPQRYPEK